jgi:hypothetical protein
MKINQEEAENIMNMLLSPDKDNSTIAFAAIEAFKFNSNNVGYLLYFYKFSKFSLDIWEKNAPKATKVLRKFVEVDKPLTYAKVLLHMMELKTCIEAIELTLKRHVKELTEMLSSMGYPTDKLDINIKLKNT